MKVIPGGLPSQEEEDVKSKEQPVISAKKLTNDMKVKSEMAENCHEARVSDDTVSCEKDCYDSCSDDDSNSNVNAQEKGKKSKASKHNDLGKAENSGIDELTTKVFKMKVKENNEDPVEDLSDKLSAITVKEEVKDSCQSKEEVKDGRQSPQLLSRGPEGGKPTAFNHQMYGTSDWSSVQADVRMKSMSGKRGFDDETNPFKYSRNLPTAENGDYVDMSYIDPITQYSLSQQHLSQQTNFQQQFLPQNVVSPEILQRPKARACRSNFNNLNQPQTSNFVNVTAKNVLSGGSVTVIPSEPVSQATPMYTTPEMDPDWDPDSLLELLAEEDDLRNVPAVTEIQKPKRNHSGDDSGYDSEVSRMSVTSPYSPESVTCMSPESLPSPKSMGQAAYMPQMAFSPASNIGSPMTNIASPHSVDSGMASAGSPSSYRDMGSPGSSISAMSPGNVMSVEPPTPQMGMPMVDASLSADTIISELNKPIPTSSVDPKVSLGQYIDDNLSQLQDVYAVIANELKDSQHKRTESALKGNKEAKQTNIPKPVGSQVSQNSKMKPVGTALPGTCTAVPMTNSMTPVILKPVTGTPITPVNSKSNNIKPVAQGVPVGPMGKVMGQPIVPVSAGQNIVWVPVNATPGVINAQPIFIMRQAPTANQKKGTSTRPRPILPKMPNVMPGTGKSSASSTVNNSKSSTAAPTAKPQTTQSTKPTMAHHVSAQPANVAQSTMIPTASSGPKQQGVNGPLPMMPGQYQQQGQFQVPQQQMFQQQLSQQQYQQHAMPQGPVPQQGMMGQQGSIPNHKLNLARRYVAEMKKENLHYQDEEGDTYLHIAICRTDPYMVKAILERLVRENLIKELIDKPNRKRQTPLYVAVADNQPQMVKELVQCGADPNFLAECKWNNGLRKEVKAAIHCAAQGGHLFSATLRELLHAKDIALNIANSEGLTALHCAIQEHGKVRGGQHLINAMPSVEMLIRAGADPNVQDKKSGKTPLMYAIETKDYNLVYSMVQLIGRDRLRNMLKTQTFDGSNCSKICSGLRMESDPDGFRKINSLILSASNGSDLRLYEQPPMMSA